MKTKNILLLFFLILAALIISALIGSLTNSIESLKWLTWSDGIGFDAVKIDLSVIDLSFSFHMQVNVLQVGLIAAALVLYNKIK